MSKQYLKDLTEFIIESNAIESEYSQQAFEDSLLAWHYLMGQTPEKMHVSKIEATHFIMMENISPGVAGRIRNENVRIGNRLAFPHELVYEKLEELVQVIPHTIEEIKDWHIRYEAIHPFVDGNGRSGRLIMNWQMVQNNWPIWVIHEGEEQMHYYKWFKK